MISFPWLQPVIQGAQDYQRGQAGPDTHDRANARGGSALVPGETSVMGQRGQTAGDFSRGLAQEGTAALADPVGMMDRMAAQRELSSRFQVVGDDFHGRRTANMVSQAEYDRICHTFSDIRLGRGDMTIDTSMMTNAAQAQTYRDGTMVAIADMMMTAGGRAQIEGMHNNVLHDDAGHVQHGPGNTPLPALPFGVDQAFPEVHRHTTIRPFFRDANGDRNLTNDPQVADNSNAMADAAGAHGENGAINLNGRNSWGRVGGRNGARGAGTDSTIWWNPTANVGNCNRSDVILAHEMQHAFHETHGTMAAGVRNMRSSRDFGINNFERQAVGLENAGDNRRDDAGLSENQYRRERNALGLGDHFTQRTHYSGTLPR